MSLVVRNHKEFFFDSSVLISRAFKRLSTHCFGFLPTTFLFWLTLTALISTVPMKPWAIFSKATLKKKNTVCYLTSTRRQS